MAEGNFPKPKRPSEAGFHEDKWKRKEEKHERRPWIQRWLDRNLTITADDYMYAEADRDNRDFDRRQHEEFKHWDESLNVVVNRLKEKRDNPERTDIRAMAVILGGGLKCPSSAGQAIGLNHVGLTAQKFHTIFGISGGSGAAAYFAAGPEQTKIGTSIFYGYCTRPEFINPLKFDGIMNVRGLTEDAMGKGDTKLDEDAIHASDTNLIFGVTRMPENGDDPIEELVDAKKTGIRKLMRASMSIPLVAGKVPPVGGVEYVDGSFDPLPIKEIIEYAKANNITDILVMPNVPFNRLDSFCLSTGEYILAELSKQLGHVVSSSSLRQVKHFMDIKRKLRESLEAVQKETGIHIGIMWPPDSGLTEFSQDGDEIETAVSESARDTIRVFGEEQPHDLGLYKSRALVSA